MAAGGRDGHGTSERAGEDVSAAGRAEFVTFAGGGFGTLQIDLATGAEPPPQAVSGRRYLRDNLPGVYADGDFTTRFVGFLTGTNGASSCLSVSIARLNSGGLCSDEGSPTPGQ